MTTTKESTKTKTIRITWDNDKKTTYYCVDEINVLGEGSLLQLIHKAGYYTIVNTSKFKTIDVGDTTDDAQ